MEILQRDLWAAYTARVTGQSPDWPAIGADVVAPAAPDATAEALDYWRRQFADPVPEPVLPERTGGRRTATSSTVVGSPGKCRRRWPGAWRALRAGSARPCSACSSRRSGWWSCATGRPVGLSSGCPRPGGTPRASRTSWASSTARSRCAWTPAVSRALPSTCGAPTARWRSGLRHSIIPFEQRGRRRVAPVAQRPFAPVPAVVQPAVVPQAPRAGEGTGRRRRGTALAGLALRPLPVRRAARTTGLRLTVVHDPDLLPTDRMKPLGDQLCHVLSPDRRRPGPAARPGGARTAEAFARTDSRAAGSDSRRGRGLDWLGERR
jgi:hypothetical protein